MCIQSIVSQALQTSRSGPVGIGNLLENYDGRCFLFRVAVFPPPRQKYTFLMFRMIIIFRYIEIKDFIANKEHFYDE